MAGTKDETCFLYSIIADGVFACVLLTLGYKHLDGVARSRTITKQGCSAFVRWLRYVCGYEILFPGDSRLVVDPVRGLRLSFWCEWLWI